MTNITDKFIKSINGAKLWPPINGCGPFSEGSRWNQKKYYTGYYDTSLDGYSVITLNDKDKSMAFLPEDIVKNLSREVFGKYLGDYDFISKRRKLFYQNIEKVDRLYFKLTYENINNKKWAKAVKETKNIIDLVWFGNAMALFSVYFDKDFCWQELKVAGFDISQKSFNSIWDKGIEPVHPSFEKNQLLHFLSLIISGRSLASVAEECQYFYGSYYDIKDVVFVERELERKYGSYLTVARARVKFDQEKKAQEKVYDNFQSWLDTLGKEEKILIDYFQTIIRLRDDRKNFINKGLVVLWRLAERLFDSVGVSHDLIPYYTPEELFLGEDYLKEHIEDLKKRLLGFTFFAPYDGPTEMAYGNISEAEKKLKDCFLKGTQTDGNIIQGQVGTKGFIQGRVKIVLEVNRVKNFKDGDILVAGMTRPEFVPLMKKASAIITDEGGITCHAAIISRELGIPCVIGTKIATQVLKDGDKVEVDANKGTVKKIK